MIEERVRLWLFPKFDAPLQEVLRLGDESAWLRLAFETFLEKLGDFPEIESREVKMNLLPRHAELLTALDRLTPHRRNRAFLMRSFAYYQLGRQEQRQSLDVDDLAARLLAAMNQRGFVVEKDSIVRPPSESELGEVLASIRQFHHR